jgi:hypothetical protein
MPRRRSLDDQWDAWPKHIASAVGASRDWMAQGKCRAIQGRIARRPWTAHRNDVIHVGRWTYRGEELIAYALLICRNCPVQWDCARFAMTTWENWGTWAMKKSEATWLHAQPDHPALIDKAQEDGVPVQIAVSAAHAAARREARLQRQLADVVPVVVAV